MKILNSIFYNFFQNKKYYLKLDTYGRLYSLNVFKLMNINYSSDFNNDNVETANNN